MDGVLTSFLSIETIVFVLIIYILVVIVRKIIEWLAKEIAYIFPDKYEPWWREIWREWILLALPSIVGGLIAFLVIGYPYPASFSSTVTARVFFGIVAGLCANNTYKFFSFYIKKLIPKKVDAETKKLKKSVSTSDSDCESLSPPPESVLPSEPDV